MLDTIFSPLTQITVNGIALWVVMLCCLGVFTAAFIDSIGGGGGIIAVPTYLMAFSGYPTYYVLGTNKLSSSIGAFFSTARFIRHGYVDWRLCIPSIALALLGSTCGVRLQHHTPDTVLKYTLLVVLPMVAVISLRGREWPDEPEEIDPKKRRAIVWVSALVLGMYDGYYGPGTGTFLMLTFIRFGKMDVKHASGCMKVINLASNFGSLCTAMAGGYVYFGVGLICAVFSILGHYLGAGLALKNGTRLVRPTITFVLVLLALKVGSELLFPEFWA